MVKRRDLDKINVNKIYNVHLFNNHKASCLWFITHYQTKKMKNNTTPTYKIFSFFLRQWLLPKIKVYYVFILQEVQKITFLHGFSTKNYKLLNDLKIS